MEGSRGLDGSSRPSASVGWRDDGGSDGVGVRVDGKLALGSFPRDVAGVVAAAVAAVVVVVRGIADVGWAASSVVRCDNGVEIICGSGGNDYCSCFGSESLADCC